MSGIVTITYRYSTTIYELNQVLDQQGRDVRRSPIHGSLIDHVKEFRLDPEGSGEPLKDLRGE